MKLKCEISLSTDATEEEMLKAIAEASTDLSRWRVVRTREEIESQTNLDNKCGSCEDFRLQPTKHCKCYGSCAAGYKGYKSRTCKACKSYRKKAGGWQY